MHVKTKKQVKRKAYKENAKIENRIDGIKDSYAKKYVAMIMRNLKTEHVTDEAIENFEAIIEKVYEDGSNDGYEACKEEFSIED